MPKDNIIRFRGTQILQPSTTHAVPGWQLKALVGPLRCAHCQAQMVTPTQGSRAWQPYCPLCDRPPEEAHAHPD